MKQITLKDCEKLYEKFMRYCDTAEQNQFGLLLLIDTNLRRALKAARSVGKIVNQAEARAMFRVVLRIIGEDCSEYEECEKSTRKS